MDVILSTTFRKQYKKAPPSIQKILQPKIDMFIANRNNPQLRNHFLKGEYKGLKSINITGDWRALYKEEIENGEIIIVFVLLGTHSQLYK